MAKKKTTVESKDVIVNKTDTQKIPVTVKDDKSQNINISKGDLNVTENKKALKFDYVNSSITLTDKLAAGNHSILINYLGNANYSSSSKTIKLSVIGDKNLNVSSSINVNGTKKVVIPITLTDSVNVYDINKNNKSIQEKTEDSFNKYYQKTKIIKTKKQPLYIYKGKKYSNQTRFLECHMDVKLVLDLAHKYNTTLTNKH